MNLGKCSTERRLAWNACELILLLWPPRGKKRFQDSPERSSKNETAADGRDRFESVVETVVERVFSRLKSELMSSVNAALGDFIRAFDDRLKSVEATCNELSLHVELQSSARNA